MAATIDLADDSSISMSLNGSASDLPSSATSPSSSDFRGPCFYYGLSPDAEAVISDISNFMALGCLSFEDFLSEDKEEARWQEVTPLPSTVDGITASNLSLLQRYGWIRLQSLRSSRWLTFRVFLLYSDVGLSCVRRDDPRLKNAIRSLLNEIDVSPDAWEGRYTPSTEQKFDVWATADPEKLSLFYLFNKIPSPAPDPKAVLDRYQREALEDILDQSSHLPGLKTRLYPYQRRSAGIMLQRESVLNRELDPRLEARRSPDGSLFYYDSRRTHFRRDPQYYEPCRGGILAESMGLGKTVICLGLILATRYHPPSMPALYATPTKRASVASLAEMASSAMNRAQIPWRVEMDRIHFHTGNEMRRCLEHLATNPPMYDIPNPPRRLSRGGKEQLFHRMILTTTTIIVVPLNLCKQWQSEIAKHVEEGFLNVLIMDNRRKPLPEIEELRSYDVILFSRDRFDAESRHGADEQGRKPTNLVCTCPYIGATRTRRCKCVRDDTLYSSPLKGLHFKRIIVDEGHFFSQSRSMGVLVASKLITADHRWVVSGTPAKDLLGVEVDLSIKDSRAAIQKRRNFSDLDHAGAIDSLGLLASKFLKVRPWSESDVAWKDYVFRHENHRRLTFSGFSSCLRKTLEEIVVRTQPDDIERDIKLPPLSHKIILLKPSFFDKLTANLFTLVLTANAVSSERQDSDYLFHKNSQKARHQLIANLRQSAFFWTGFNHEDVLASIKNSAAYLAKEGTGCTPEDRHLLTDALSCTGTILDSTGWELMSRSHELGMFIEAWPEQSAEHWAFDSCTQPLLTGISQLLDAQKFVDQRLGLDDPGEGLSGAGIKSLAPIRHQRSDDKKDTKDAEEVEDQKKPKTKGGVPVGVPSSSLEGEPSLRRRASFSSNCSSPKKHSGLSQTSSARKTKSKKRKISQTDHDAAPSTLDENVEQTSLSPNSPYAKARIVGTSSSKMSYLVSQILKYYKEEKVIVFYQGDNVAYYIAQVLELFHIQHEIYAKSLAPLLKASYVVRFDQEPQDRVLLMDVSQAAYGLNLSSASRIYFVNPVCRPDIEAQAIKRAHRIGQSRPVYIETLVLEGAIEEKMLERSQRMTKAEHHDAKSLEDDGDIQQIIQSARRLHVREEERSGSGQMAPIESPEQLWARNGRIETSKAPSSKYREQKRVVLEDATDPNEMERFIYDDGITRTQAGTKRIRISDTTTPQATSSADQPSDDEPLLERWSRRFSLSTQTEPRKLTLPAIADQESLPVLSSSSQEAMPGGGSSERQPDHLSQPQLLNDRPET